MEEDADFFPHPFSEHLADDGLLAVNEANLTHLDERLADIHQRAKYYNDYSLTKIDFLGMIEDLQAMTSALRRTAR